MGAKRRRSPAPGASSKGTSSAKGSAKKLARGASAKAKGKGKGKGTAGKGASAKTVQGGKRIRVGKKRDQVTLFKRVKQAANRLLEAENVEFSIGNEIKGQKIFLKIGYADLPSEVENFKCPEELIEHKIRSDKPPKFVKIVKNMCDYKKYPWLKVNKKDQDSHTKCDCFVKDKIAEQKEAEAEADSDTDTNAETDAEGGAVQNNNVLPPRSSSRLAGSKDKDNGAADGVNGAQRCCEKGGEAKEVVARPKKTGCSRSCINQLLQMECNADNCSYMDGSQCANRLFTQREYAAVAPKRAGMKGWGLQLLQDVAAGQFIVEYVGEMIPTVECETRLRREYALYKKNKKHKVNHYFLTLNNDMIIDARTHGGGARFINHSCEPTCEIQLWQSGGEVRAGMFARIDLKAEAELTIDYRYEYLDNEQLKSQPCYCGSDSCVKYIGAPREDSSKTTTKDSGKKKKKKLGKRVLREHLLLQSDSLCSICGKGGDLMICDGSVDRRPCPRTYHCKCLNMDSVPNFKWLCPYHFCDECGKPPSVFCRYCSDSWCRQCHPKELRELEFETQSNITWVCCPECEMEPLNPDRTPEEIEQMLEEAKAINAQHNRTKRKDHLCRQAKGKSSKKSTKGTSHKKKGTKGTKGTKATSSSKKVAKDLISIEDAKDLLRGFSPPSRVSMEIQVKIMQRVFNKKTLLHKESLRISEDLKLPESRVQDWFAHAKNLWQKN